MSQVVQDSSNLKTLYLIGGGGHCQAVVDSIESQNEYRITGIFDLKEKIGVNICGYPIIDSDENIKDYINNDSWFLITIGHLYNNTLRLKLFKKLIENNANIATIISKTAIISNYSTIGKGSVVMAGAIISAGTIIGQNCIINSKALIEHGCEIGDNCHISTNATINGDVRIGQNVFFGSSSTAIQGINISENKFIKAQTLVKKDL